MTSDMDLVREYARDSSEEAFVELVSRHVNLVYSVALHQLRDAPLAEEVTQVTFIILARKAGSLGPQTILSAWLCRTAQYTAARALRTERRRQGREQEAYMQSMLNQPEPETSPWPDIAPLLNLAMAGLGEKEHSAIVLRFFEGKDLKQVAAALEVGEDTAKTRVRRGVEKLRKFFVKRGITLSASVIAGAISANAVEAAPVGLVKSISAVAITKGATASGSTLALIKGALKIMAWTKAKTAVVVGVAVILAAAILTPSVTHYYQRSNSALMRLNPKTADEAARGIFEDWAKGDWDAFYSKFAPPGERAMYENAFTTKVKNYVAGMQIVSLGEPESGESADLWYVPCKIRLRDGSAREFRLHLAQDPETKRWYFKGGI